MYETIENFAVLRVKLFAIHIHRKRYAIRGFLEIVEIQKTAAFVCCENY